MEKVTHLYRELSSVAPSCTLCCEKFSSSEREVDGGIVCEPKEATYMDFFKLDW